MNYTVIWQPTALNTYVDQVDFIFLKWNFKENQKFQDLVLENLERLSKKAQIGIFISELGSYSLMLSKQITSSYNFNSNNKIIDLHAFWNNEKKS